MPGKSVVGWKKILLLVLLLFLVFFLHPFLASTTAQDTHFIIWVFDKSLRDSQFGYYDGTTVQATEPIYIGADIEGLACLNDVIYASGGLDGQAPSTLNTVVIDVATNTTTLSKIADLQTVEGNPFFEVISLSARADGTLWGYADNPPLRGIIQIDPASGVAELVVPANHKVEGVAWLDNTLWLAGNHRLYYWTAGGNITAAFDVAGVGQIEALEAIDGLLYGGVHKDDRGVIAIDPNTGTIVEGKGFLAPNDIEGLTFCPLQPAPTPAPTTTDTPTATPMPTAVSTETLSATPTATETPITIIVQTPTPTVTATDTPTATPTREPPSEPPTALDPADEPDVPTATTLYLPLVMR